MRGTAPPSQKDRPISLVLEVDGAIQKSVTLALRPEDFSLTEPSRTTVTHTLGGAFADCFGPGLPSITLSGHTGWRPYQGSESGEARFKALREIVTSAWHEARRNAVEQGRDPAGSVRLIYNDALSDLSVVVAPMQCTLRRSRSRPLLLAYSLAMTVLDRNDAQRTFMAGRSSAQDATGEYEDIADLEAPLEAVGDDILDISGGLGDAEGLDAELGDALDGFASRSAEVFSGATALLRAGRDMATDATAFVSDLAAAGMHAFQQAVPMVGGVVMQAGGGIATVRSIAAPALATVNRLSAIASAFYGVYCFFQRLRRADLMLDISAFFGASGCSSSAGGRGPSIFASRNTWDFVPFSAGAAGSAAGFRLTGAGRDGISRLLSADPLLDQLGRDDLLGASLDAAGGLEALTE